ncbi:5-oxoprolinase subunit PxpA [Microbacterium sp. bgisy207]|uniref:5-oxoprolinase subunit PxpA n=1 Tax=Microbacterium sp. bgisy207 TaxID=3413800 RepID=UPI003EB8701D
MTTIDLNADLGETVDGVPTADDEALFAVISSANVACGGHAGDARSMGQAVERAARFGVAIGAHPSYPDRSGFGRRAVAMSGADLRAAVGAQLHALADVGADIRYVKPHGALYHAVRTDAAHADALAAAVSDLARRLGRALPILGMSGAITTAAAGHGLEVVEEAFLDRGYAADGTLVPRDRPGALIEDPEAAASRAVQLAHEGTVVAIDGATVPVRAASLCVHGDSPASVAAARAVRAALAAASVTVRAPW